MILVSLVRGATVARANLASQDPWLLKKVSASHRDTAYLCANVFPDGERIDDLKLIMSRVAFATSLFDQDGIQVRAVPPGPGHTANPCDRSDS